jgi:hypothetical protein
MDNNNTHLSNNPFAGLFKSPVEISPTPVVQQVNEPTKTQINLQIDSNKFDNEINELLELTFHVTLRKSNYDSSDSKSLVLFIGDFFENEDLMNKKNIDEVIYIVK